MKKFKRDWGDPPLAWWQKAANGIADCGEVLAMLLALLVRRPLLLVLFIVLAIVLSQ
ncbi:hypothetical protein C942_02218 [Photobacterium marinum]|uniref:Uncharacterized protein n=1 Tax=Photobacterium marinum TaxID=1056511 RepID=L8JB45_9GAMM|nr:hypothetical protein [Photobacterium marinum]ELR64647.1 hypothetical protein C942_02218 [Photobacterium marinum]